MPSRTGVVQEAGVPLTPSISTRHMRQEPQASTLSVEHSFGTCRSAREAARMTLVPAGTLTCAPSIQRETEAPVLAGVP